MGIDSRSALISSLTAFHSSQEVLPNVDIPHITQRQIVAVSHANEYLLTDIANIDRYHHTQRVMNAYHESLDNSMKWLHETFERTLRKDLNDAENTVLAIAKRLRQHRMNYIQLKVGNKSYTRNEN